MGLVSGIVALFVVLLAWSAPWWTKHLHLYRILVVVFWGLLLGAPLVILWFAAPDTPIKARTEAADRALQKVVDAFPEAWCREPSARGDTSVTFALLPSSPALKEKDVVERWTEIYTQPMTCPVTARQSRALSSSPSAQPSSQTTAPGTASNDVDEALATWEASRRLGIEERAGLAGRQLDDDVVPDDVVPLKGGWPIWLLALAVALWAMRRVYVEGRLRGHAPLSLVPPATGSGDPTAAEKEAARAFLAAAQEIKLVRPSAAPVSGVDDVIQSLTAVNQVPAGRWFAEALKAVWTFVRVDVRYDARIVGNPVADGRHGIVVGVTAYPGGRGVVDRSVSGPDGRELGRSAAFDAGCAVLSASRKVPRYARWPAGTGEGLRLYVEAMRESPLAAAAGPQSVQDQRRHRRDLLRRAVRVAPGNGLVRHELALLEFQTGQFVCAAARLVENVRQYPEFVESRYRFAVTLAMISQDVDAHWFPESPAVRRAIVDLLVPEVSPVRASVLAPRATPSTADTTRRWLLEQAKTELRRLTWRVGWKALSPFTPRTVRHLLPIGRAALLGTTLVLDAEDARDTAPDAKVADRLARHARKLVQLGRGSRHWQVTYNCACALARLHGTVHDGGARVGAWGDPAVELLRKAVHHADFALPRWQDDILDLISRADPDLRPVADLPAFVTLTAMLAPKESNDATARR